MKAKINGTAIENLGDKYLTTVLILYFSKHFPFQSGRKIKENIKELLSFISEKLVQTKNKNLDKDILSLKRKISFFLKNIDKIESKENVIKAIYNFLLSLDGLSTLPGFGMTNRFKDKININPEKTSIY